MKRTRELLASDIALIDPLDCGSSVGYVITKSRHGLSAEIELTDCNRKIQWYFSSDVGAVAKIDKAINLLENFRAAFIKARRGRK